MVMIGVKAALTATKWLKAASLAGKAGTICLALAPIFNQIKRIKEEK